MQARNVLIPYYENLMPSALIPDDRSKQMSLEEMKARIEELKIRLPIILQKMTATKVHFLIKEPFFGVLLIQMEIMPNLNVERIYATPKKILYNPEYFEELSPAQFQGAILHGLLHQVFDHISRGQNKSPQLWELATDYAIAFVIQDSGYELPPEHPYDSSYQGWTAEEIYHNLSEKANDSNSNGSGDNDENPPSFDQLPTMEDIKQEQKEDNLDDESNSENRRNNLPQPQHRDEEDFDKENQSGNNRDDSEPEVNTNQDDEDDHGDDSENTSDDGHLESELDEMEPNSKSNSNSDCNPNQNEVSDESDQRESTDHQNQNDELCEHSPSAPEHPENQEYEVEQMFTMPSSNVPPDDIQQFANLCQDAFITAKGQGYIPSEVVRSLKELSKPVVNWQKLLAKFVQTSCNNDFRWNPPNVKYLANDMIFPTNRVKTISLVLAIDTSGSISQEILQKFITEIKGIVAHFNEYEMTVISCDAIVHDVLKYNSYKPVKDEEILNLKGGGGTDFRPVFDYIIKNRIRPDCLVYMTDGEGTFPDRPPIYPMLWFMITDVQPPWGNCVYYAL
jgi:predicted metal-dependent peptidase